MVQRDANLLGAPCLELGTDAFRLATDDQCRRSRPIAGVVGSRGRGTGDDTARQALPQLVEGANVERESGTRKCAPIPARTTFGFQGSTVSGER